LLALLGASGEQDHQRLAVAPEINPVARPPIDPVFENPSPTLFAFEVFPCPNRTSATDTLAAAGASRSENQLSNGLSPPAVR
jgi:hypothetical protein